ncbi:unnamed protein product [Linum tenue]|uniref:F-box domain-containing protein n=1 Tax=Linum tenue TaxID=586396 RepID=A0AAV0NJ94_9ROSI|nr:unnamed protein product [Linum tenue]
MKALNESDADRISSLPDDVIQSILAFLPVKDGAKTATLSKQWRHNWGATAKLVFNGGFCQISAVEDYVLKASKLMWEIYKALLLHEGPITELVLEIPGLRPCTDMDLMMLFVSKKSVQKLTLSFYEKRALEDKISSALFTARQLSYLRLRNCEFSAPSWFLGFSKLARLDLYGVHVPSPSNFCEDFLPKCPVLQHLIFVIQGSDSRKAELVSPSLKVFESNLWNVCFKHTPFLSTVRIELMDVYQNDKLSKYRAYDPDIAAAFSSLPAIEKLIIGGQWMGFLASGKVPSKLPTYLHQLKDLKLGDILLYRLSEARVLVCLIASSPNLRKLTVVCNCIHASLPKKRTIDILKLLEEHDHPTASCFQCLEEMSISDVLGMRVELNLLRFVLATAPQLRRIFIKPDGKMDPRKAHKFLKEVTRFKRLSREAEVIYVSKDEN